MILNKISKREQNRKNYEFFIETVNNIAYYKWENTGKPEGKSEYFWNEAIKEVRLRKEIDQIQKDLQKHHRCCDNEPIYFADW